MILVVSGACACGVLLDDIKLQETFGDGSNCSSGSCGRTSPSLPHVFRHGCILTIRSLDMDCCFRFSSQK
jgi:hypothetical protein